MLRNAYRYSAHITRELVTRAFSFLSHLIGINSVIAPKVNQATAMGMDIVLAVVSLGYVTSAIMTVLLFFGINLPNFVFAITVTTLVCAARFEFLNNQIQNADSRMKSESWRRYPIMTQMLMLLTSGLGALQYLIRHYSLVLNFGNSRPGRALIMSIRHAGYAMSSARFAILGGKVAFVSHFMLSFLNWDKWTKFNPNDSSMKGTAKLMWGVIFSALLLQMVSMQAMIFVGLCLWTVSHIKQPKMIKHSIARLDAIWVRNAHLCLPVGAFLYGLVDFYNSYAIVMQLGWLNYITFAACLGFGAISFINTATIWGYNMVRHLYAHRGERFAQVRSNQHPVVRYFHTAPSIKRLSVYLRDSGLCIIDLMSNSLFLNSVVNQTLMNVFGISIPLWGLNICTICYAANKIVTSKFQSGIDIEQYTDIDDKIKDTWGAKKAQVAVDVIEKDIPEFIFGPSTAKA